MDTDRAEGQRPAQPPHPSSPGSRRHEGARLLLVALTVAIAVQIFRVLFPLAYHRGEETSFIRAGVFTLVVFLAPLGTAMVRRVLGRMSPLLVLGALAALRVAIQVAHGASFSIVVAATAIALVALTMVLAAVRASGATGGREMAVGVVLGLALDTGLRAAFWSWDYAWQPGIVPAVLAVVLSLALCLVAWKLRRALAARVEGPLRASVAAGGIGPYLVLQMLFLQSVAFAASQAGTSLPAATAVVLVGDAIALAAMLDRSGVLPRLGVGVGAVVLALDILLLRVATGTAVLALIVAGQAIAGLLLRSAMSGPGTGRIGLWRTSLGVGIGSFSFLLLTLLYQLHYEYPLPFPNVVLPMVGALLLGVAAVLARPDRAASSRVAGRRPIDRWIPLVPVSLLAIPFALALGRPDDQVAVSPSRSLRIVDYNVHEAVDVTGRLDPEAIARAILDQHPDVVALQEIGRGWAISGTIDLAEWLSQRLRMRYAWGPAADGQFGNVLLSRLPMTNVGSVTLPQGTGSMSRSYVRADIVLGHSTSIAVFDVHLQHHDDQTTTRLQEIAILLAGWNEESPAVIAGDLNAEPGSQEIARIGSEGLISAQDASGNGSLPTADSLDPDHRIDWIFGSADLGWADFVITRTTASDHLPLAVTAVVGR